jgi:hypothetical protein
MLILLPSAISELLQSASRQASIGEHQQLPFTNERRPIADEPVSHLRTFVVKTQSGSRLALLRSVRGNSNLCIPM